MLSIPTGLVVTGLVQPRTSVQSQKLTPCVNHCLGARRLHIQDLNQQQSVRIDLRSIWRHGRDDLAFGLDGLVTLKSDEVNEGLAGPQFGQETDTSVSRAESDSRKKQQAGGSLWFAFHLHPLILESRRRPLRA